MDEKIGIFIKQLREDNHITQQELANKLNISRQVISKWENSISTPDADNIKRLANIFNVSVSEIILGEYSKKINEDKKEESILSIYDILKKEKKITKILIGIIFIIVIFSLFVSYFFTFYKSLKIYIINGDSENVSVRDGLFVKTKEKIYLQIGNIKIDGDKKIKKITLYYKDKNNEDKLIAKDTNNNMLISDYNGYNEYINFKEINYMLKNMYLDVEFEDSKETIKINCKEDYVNDSFFSYKRYINSVGDETNKEKELDVNILNLINNIKKYYTLNDDNYIIKIFKEDYEYNLSYNDDLKTLFINKNKNSVIEEQVILQLNDDFINYKNNISNKMFGYNYNSKKIINCENNCDNYKEILKEFNAILSESINCNESLLSF